VDIYCTRPNCSQPVNAFPELDTSQNLKTVTQKFCTFCGMPLILGGRYFVDRPLARGGFGVTYIGRDRYTPAMRKCVIKQFLPSGLAPQQLAIAKEMFEREAAVLEDIGTHPQIPDLFAFLDVPAGKDEFFYLIQEFIDGFTLEEIINQYGGVSETDLLEMMYSLLPVIQFVHDKGSIHRDIKPSNIMIRKSDQVYYLLDFGAVKQIATAGGPRSTGIYTPGYGAPEQMRGDRVFPSTDLYAFAATCLHMLTGKPPEDLWDPVRNQWHWEDVVTMSPALDRVFKRMLATAPNDRFGSADEVLENLNYAFPQAQPSKFTKPSSGFSQPVNTSSAPSSIPNSIPHTTAQSVPSNPAPAPVVPPPIQQQKSSPVTPAAPAPSTPQVSRPPSGIMAVPIGKQLIAAFLLGVEGMALWLVTDTIGKSLLGPSASLMLFGGVIVTLILLRVSAILDNKDLAVFVNMPTLLAVWLLPSVIKIGMIQALPGIFTVLPLAVVAGFASVAVMAAFRLIFQFLYRLL
jgi:serine/threonine protein kinase